MEVKLFQRTAVVVDSKFAAIEFVVAVTPATCTCTASAAAGASVASTAAITATIVSPVVVAAAVAAAAVVVVAAAAIVVPVVVVAVPATIAGVYLLFLAAFLPLHTPSLDSLPLRPPRTGRST